MSDIDALFMGAAAHHRAGRLKQARAACQALLRVNPKHQDALHLLGLLAYQDGDYMAAAELIDRALLQDPNQAAFWMNRGLVHQAQGKTAEAEASYLRTLDLQPHTPVAYRNLGDLFSATNRLEEAEKYYRLALALMPDSVEVCNNLGGLLARMGRMEEARGCYHRAIDLEPDNAGLHYNLGLSLHMQYKPEYLEEAERSYRRATEINPDFVGAHINLGEVLRFLGHFREGWDKYEYRFRRKDIVPVQRPLLNYPEWRGEDLSGRRLLLVGEQGYGDQIQYVRYVGVLRDLGAEVDIVVSSALVELLQTVPGVGRVFSKLPQKTYDYWSMMLSVPGRVGTELSNIPAEIPYIHADEAGLKRWKVRLEKIAGSRKKVGVVWACSLPPVECSRSMYLHDLAPLAGVDDVQWFSLQKGPAEAELASTSGGLIPHHLGQELKNFSDTAAVIGNLDLVITVDTSVTHVAGALAKPAWVLIPADSDWKWMLEGDDSPWYPTVKLFRQQRLEDWSGTVAAVKFALREFAG